MELDELHVDHLGTRTVGERVTVAGALPAVAGDLVGAADAARRQNDRLRREQLKAALLAVVGQRARGTPAVEQQLDDRVLLAE
jgi:hypothetical protein